MDNDERKLSALDRRALTLAGLDLVTANLAALNQRLTDDFTVEDFGFAQFSGLEDLQARAIASDQLLSSVDAITLNLIEARLHERAFIVLVGPNGRTVPDPDQADEDLEALERGMHLTGFFRALGSALDCLAAAVVAVARSPESIARADQASFVRLLKRAKREPVLADLAAVLRASNEAEPVGWLEWTVEMRNNVIHRARQLDVWLPAARPKTGRTLYLQTERKAHELLRSRPHLRRQPWLPDMDALSRPETASGAWMAEPTCRTLPQLRQRANALAETVARELLNLWTRTGAGDVELAAPAQKWVPQAPRPAWRVEKAEQFAGFDPDYWTPPGASILMNPRDAARATVAGRLRNL